MVLTLFVYNYAQWWVRKQLKKKKEYYYDQKGEWTQKPTFKWVCETMRHVIQVKITAVVTNCGNIPLLALNYFKPKFFQNL